MLLPWPSSSPAPRQHEQPGQQQLTVGCAVELEDEQPRSVAVLPVGGDEVLLVGTNSGRVLMWQIDLLERQQQPSQQQGQSNQAGMIAATCDARWVLRHSRTVQISSSSVSLLPLNLPPAGIGSGGSGSSSLPCIYAHAGAGAVVRPIQALVRARQGQSRQQQQHLQSNALRSSLAATDCLQVSRVCGSEACLSAAPVQSPDMAPHSLAWVSASSRLCFGQLDAVHKLRWRSRGLPGSPLAMALHKPSNTLLLVVQADGSNRSGSGSGPAQESSQQQQQQLVLVDCRSLAVLMTLALAAGQHCTSLAVLDLPCTSQQQQQQQRQHSPPVKGAGLVGGDASTAAAGSTSSSSPFIVLGSYVNLDLSATSAAGAGQADAEQCSSLDAYQQLLRRQRQQQQQQQPFNGQMQVSGGTQDYATADAARPDIVQIGVLSFFELKTSMQNPQAVPGAAAGGAGNAQRLCYDLVLHGMAPVPVTPACVCTVVPEVMMQQQQQQQQERGSSAHAGGRSSGSSGGAPPADAAAAVPPRLADSALHDQPACLAVGSEAGVTLFSVLVDDAGVAEHTQLQQQLKATAQVRECLAVCLGCCVHC